MRRDLRTQLLLFTAPVILITTALVQRYLAEVHALNPWKGGGFGMFADLPKTPYRTLKLKPVEASEPPLEYFTPTPRGMAREDEALRTLPSRRRLVRFAQQLADDAWVLVGLEREESGRYPVLKRHAHYHKSSRPITLKGVRVELWQYDFDPATLRLVPSRLHEIKAFTQRP